jgi:hypothetical protein
MPVPLQNTCLEPGTDRFDAGYRHGLDLLPAVYEWNPDRRRDRLHLVTQAPPLKARESPGARNLAARPHPFPSPRSQVALGNAIVFEAVLRQAWRHTTR